MWDLWTVRACWVIVMLIAMVGHGVRVARVCRAAVVRSHRTDSLYKVIMQIHYWVCVVALCSALV